MWDERIDDVAQRMTAGQPRANLRAPVIHRIETAAHRHLWRPLVGLPATAAAVATALLVVFALSTRDKDAPTETNASAPREPAKAIAAASAAPAPPPAETRSAVLAPTARIVRNPESVERAREIIDRGAAPLLPPPVSIQLAPLDFETLPAVESIAAEPLELAALEVETVDQQTDRQRQ